MTVKLVMVFVCGGGALASYSNENYRAADLELLSFSAASSFSLTKITSVGLTGENGFFLAPCIFSRGQTQFNGQLKWESFFLRSVFIDL